MKKTIPLFLFTVLFISSVAFAQDSKTKIKFATHWLPQAQFAGYYIGVEKGFYEKYGLDVEIVHASPNITSQEMLLDGKVNMASMFLSTALVLRSYGHQVVNVCQLSQKSAQVLVSRKGDNIVNAWDFDGKSISIWRSGFSEITSAFINRNNIKVNIIPVSSTVNLFLRGGVDVTLTMWYNEYHTILNSGINEEELNTLFFSENGLNVPEDGIYCLEKDYDEKTVNKFVNATLEAWQYAFDHPEETLDIVINIMNANFVPANRAHQNWMLKRMQDLFFPESRKDSIGNLERNDFINAVNILSDLGKIEHKLNYEEFYFGDK